jgi:hypothetical protein
MFGNFLPTKDIMLFFKVVVYYLMAKINENKCWMI